MLKYDMVWAREYAGISQAKLAEILGVSRRTVINWEQGHTKISYAKVKFVLDALNIDPKLVPQNKQPEPVTTPVTSPVVAPPPAPAATQSKPAKRDWTNRPFKEFQKDVLKIAVELSDKQESFDVPDVMASWLRVWRKDETKIDDAWQFAFSMLRYLEMQDEALARVNPEEKDYTLWKWTLTPKGWKAFEAGYRLYDEDDPTARQKYPNTFNRLFGDLV